MALDAIASAFRSLWRKIRGKSRDNENREGDRSQSVPRSSYTHEVIPDSRVVDVYKETSRSSCTNIHDVRRSSPVLDTGSRVADVYREPPRAWNVIPTVQPVDLRNVMISEPIEQPEIIEKLVSQIIEKFVKFNKFEHNNQNNCGKHFVLPIIYTTKIK